MKAECYHERNSNKLKLAKYKSTEVTLSEEQHEDMNAVLKKLVKMSWRRFLLKEMHMMLEPR